MCICNLCKRMLIRVFLYTYSCSLIFLQPFVQHPKEFLKLLTKFQELKELFGNIEMPKNPRETFLPPFVSGDGQNSLSCLDSILPQFYISKNNVKH